MKISTEQKLDNFKNMRSMINDYKKQHDRYPNNDEFVEKLEMSIATVIRYKKVILDEDKKKILDTFQDDIIKDVEDLQKEIQANIKIFKKIRDGEIADNTDKMNAARNMQESYLDLIRIKRDAPEFLGMNYSQNENNNDVQSSQEYIHESEESSDITEGITHLFD